jgi:hypothetical protein
VGFITTEQGPFFDGHAGEHLSGEAVSNTLKLEAAARSID